MINEILEVMDKLGKLCSAFKVSMILGVIINLIIISILFRLTDAFIRKIRERYSENENAVTFNHILPILDKIIKFLIVFIITASFLQSQGYSLTSLIAGFGITGLAVSFAAQQTIASMFGTIAILSDKIYKVGDYIKASGVEGTVESISLRSTKVRTLDNFLVTIPNDTMANCVIENISKAGKRRLDLIFGVTYDTSDEKLQQAMELVKEVMNERSDVYKDFTVVVETLDSSSINIRLLGYAKTKAYDNFIQIRSSVYLETVRKFRQNKIEFAFPSQTIYMAK